MIKNLKAFYFQGNITLLAIFKPVTLFDKINQLTWYKKTLHRWIDEQHFTANSKILEAGCATGALTSHIAQSGHRVTGVDYDSKMIHLAKAKNKHCDFAVADVLDLPFEENQFDVVIATSLINIVSDKYRAINELSRTCKKGGVLSILVPSSDFNNDDFIFLRNSLEESGFSLAALGAWHKKAPKMKTSNILKLFEQAGLTNIATKKYLQGMVVSISAIKPS